MSSVTLIKDAHQKGRPTKACKDTSSIKSDTSHCSTDPVFEAISEGVRMRNLSKPTAGSLQRSKDDVRLKSKSDPSRPNSKSDSSHPTSKSDPSRPTSKSDASHPKSKNDARWSSIDAAQSRESVIMAPEVNRASLQPKDDVRPKSTNAARSRWASVRLSIRGLWCIKEEA
jgi:hypothetical protein